MLRSIYMVLSGLAHHELVNRIASTAEDKNLGDVETLIFDIRELLAQYILENSYE